MVTSRTAWTPPNATLMLRISTRGVPCATVTALPPPRSGTAPAVQGVEADGEDQHDPGRNVLPRRVDADEAKPVVQGRQHERAEHGTRDRPDAAGERGSANHGRRDHVQLVAGADVEGRAVEARRRD